MTISQSRWGMNAEVGRNPITPKKRESSGMGGLAAGAALTGGGIAGYKGQAVYRARAHAGARQGHLNVKPYYTEGEKIAQRQKIQELTVRDLQGNRIFARATDPHGGNAHWPIRYNPAKHPKPPANLTAKGQLDRSLKGVKETTRRMVALQGQQKVNVEATQAARAANAHLFSRYARAQKIGRFAKPAGAAAIAGGAALFAGSLVRGRGGKPGRYQRPLREPGRY